MKPVRLLCCMFLLAFFIVPDRAQSSLAFLILKEGRYNEANPKENHGWTNLKNVKTDRNCGF